MILGIQMRTKSTILLSGLAVLFLSTAGSVATAGTILGDTVTIEYLYPDSATLYGLSATGTVTPTGVTLNLFGEVSVTVFGNDVQMIGTGGGTYSAAAFNGVSVQDITNPSAFTGFSVDAATTIGGFNLSDIAISGGLLYINYEGLPAPTGALAQVDFTSSASVPEPGTLPLLTVGLLGAAGIFRRRFLGRN
jgi:PEP-CTERM motif